MDSGYSPAACVDVDSNVWRLETNVRGFQVWIWVFLGKAMVKGLAQKGMGAGLPLASSLSRGCTDACTCDGSDWPFRKLHTHTHAHTHTHTNRRLAPTSVNDTSKVHSLNPESEDAVSQTKPIVTTRRHPSFRSVVTLKLAAAEELERLKASMKAGTTTTRITFFVSVRMLGNPKP